MSNDSTKRDLKDILSRLRDIEVNTELHSIRDRVDQHMMLSLLDVAEWKQRLIIFADGRSMGFACGVEEKYAYASLRRLCTVKSPQGGTKLVNLTKKFKIPRHPRQAYIYAVNPVFPLVQSIDREVIKSLTSLRSADEKTPVAIPSEGMTLIDFYKDAALTPSHCEMMMRDNLGRMTAQGVTRRGMLIGRTSLGITLGKPAVAVYLSLVDMWTYKDDIAHANGMSPDYAYRLLRDTLAPMGLARSNTAQWVRFGKSGKRLLWRRGVPIEQCHPKNLPDVLDARLRRWAKQRDMQKVKYPVTEAEWIAAEISAMADKVEGT